MVSYLDTAGPMARDVADLALLHAVIVGQKESARPQPVSIRIGLPRRPFWGDLANEVAESAEASIEALRTKGVTFVDVDLSEVAAATIKMQIALGGFGRRRDMATFLALNGLPSLDELIASITSRDVRAIYENSKLPDGQEQTLLLEEFPQLLSRLKRQFEEYRLDALAYPTAPITAPLIVTRGDALGDEIELNGRRVSTSATTSRHARFAPGLGLPALSLPVGLGRESRMPVGLEFAALPGQDSKVLALGRVVQDLLARPV